MDTNTNPPTSQSAASGGGQPPKPVTGQPTSGQPVAGKPAGGAKGDLSGIMEENVDISSLVANAGNPQQVQDFVAWAKGKIPLHPVTKFDEAKFIQLLAGSISLTLNEKKRIVESIGKLSQFQIDELMKIFEEEQQKFTELEKKHAAQMAELEKQHAQSPEVLQAKAEEEAKKAREAKEAEDIKKKLGLA